MNNKQKFYFMQRACELAKTYLGFCMPNPSVGAVVVVDNKIIAEGYHLGSGTIHAEPCALEKISEPLNNAILFVTLEPCCTFGKTPPCTDLIIKRGIKHVIFGHYDANPDVAGKGVATLIAADIVCEHFTIPEIVTLYQAYDYWHKYKLPFVTTKLALSFDGKVSLNPSKPIKISSPYLDRITHNYRKQSCAMLSTSRTINSDDPYFNARIGDTISYSKRFYLMDRTLSVNLNANIFSTTQNLTIFYGYDVNHKRLVDLKNKGARCIQVAEDDGKLVLAEILALIGSDGIQHLWVEAGPHLFYSFAKSKLLANALLYYSPKILGNTAYSGLINQDILVNVKNIYWESFQQEAICHLSWY